MKTTECDNVTGASVLSRFSHVGLCGTSRTVACRALLSMGFSRQEYWSGLPFAPPEDLPDPGIELTSPASPLLQADSLTTEPSGKAYIYALIYNTCFYLSD